MRFGNGHLAYSAGIRGSLLALLAAGAIAGCGSKDKGDRGGGDEPAGDPVIDPAPTGSTGQENSGEHLQLGDETVGVKNGDQIVAHYSLVTGIKFDALTDNQKAEVNNLRRSLPVDNSVGKFNGTHVLTATKLANFFCDNFLNAEVLARGTTPPAGSAPKLPDYDWASTKFPVDVASSLSERMLSLFWGVDIANLPAATDIQAIVEELATSLGQPVTVAGQVRQVNFRRGAQALCVTYLAAWPALEQ